MPADLFPRLRRWPDIEGPDLLAVDPADRLILDEAAAALADDPRASEPGALAVLGDLYGALTLGAVAQLGAQGVRTHTDELNGELALEANAERVELGDAFTSFGAMSADVVRDARIVLLRLPRGLDELTEMVNLVADYAAPDVVVFAGGRLKYMTRGMNDVLATRFGQVTASLARGKSRVLIARELDPALSAAQSFPMQERHDDVGLTVCAHGGAFAGTKVDIGTRFLLEQLRRVDGDAVTAVDLGCGTGVLAAAFAKARPDAHVIASDQSAAACASAQATAEANGVGDRVQVVREDALAGVPDASVDVVLCNPPFHMGATVHTGTASKMFRAAARVLRPGGELWTVYNSHLLHKAELTKLIGRTEQIAKNPKFTVTRSTRRIS